MAGLQYEKVAKIPMIHSAARPRPAVFSQTAVTLSPTVSFFVSVFSPLFFFANGQRAIRVVSACNTHASNEQRAIRAVCACSTRASIRLSVFADAHAFSYRPLYRILRKRRSEGSRKIAQLRIVR